jgi:putative glutamine amidotransferase
MRPLVGITTDHETNRYDQAVTTLTEAYTVAVANAGGIPVLISSALDQTARRDLFARLDGILLAGGGDLDPAHYRSAYHGRLSNVHPPRDELELELAGMAASAGKPFLGICRGCQVLNVALGGTLYPDLATAPSGPIMHDLPGNERNVLVHEVAIEPGTQLEKILQERTIGVNSHHHQGLLEIGAGLHVAARAPDGLVEAVELEGHPFCLAVQWHPEWLTHQRWTQDLLRAFVVAAAAALRTEV